MLLSQEVWKDNLYLKLIGEELLRRAEADTEFKAKLEEADCTLSDVFSYITDEVSKMPQVNRCVAVDDATVYGMADKYIREDIWKQVKEKKQKAQEESKERAKRKEEREELRKTASKGAGILSTTSKSTKAPETAENEPLDTEDEEEVEVEEKPVKKEKKEVKAKPKKETLEDVFGGLFD